MLPELTMFVRENRTKQNAGGSPPPEKDTPRPFKEANSIYTDFIFLPAFPDLCFLYILYKYIWCGAARWGFCRGSGRAAWPRLELAARTPPPLQSTLNSVFFYNKTSVNLQRVHVWGALCQLRGRGGHSELTVWSCVPRLPAGREGDRGSTVTESRVLGGPGPGMSTLWGSVLRGPPWASAPPPRPRAVRTRPPRPGAAGGSREDTGKAAEAPRLQAPRPGPGAPLPRPYLGSPGRGERIFRFRDGSFRIQPNYMASVAKLCGCVTQFPYLPSPTSGVWVASESLSGFAKGTRQGLWALRGLHPGLAPDGGPERGWGPPSRPGDWGPLGRLSPWCRRQPRSLPGTIRGEGRPAANEFGRAGPKTGPAS